MTFGLQITNSNGEVVIDGEYRNHCVLESGSVATNGVAFGVNSMTAKVTLSTPVAMTRSPLIWGKTSIDDVLCGLVGMEINGADQLTGFWVATWYKYAGAPEPGRTVYWQVTAAPSGASGEAYGMRVYDAAGAVAFDSGYDYIDIAYVSSPLYVIQGVWPGVITAPDNVVTHASFTDPWYCLSAIAYLRTISPSGDDTLWECAMAGRVSATQSRLNVRDYAYQGGDTFWSNIGGFEARRQLVIGI